jgi:hypothetical protein
MPLDDTTLKRLRGDGERKESLVTRLAFGDQDLKAPKHDEILLRLDALLKVDGLVSDIGERFAGFDGSTVREKVWEFALGDSRFTAGFIDLIAAIGGPRGGCSALAFEIKTTIPSIGELVRQLRFYETKPIRQIGANYITGAVRFVVVSPDERWADALAGQGFGFLSYPNRKATVPWT